MAYTVKREDLATISDVELAFSTERLLPNWDDIPQAYKDGNVYTKIAEAIFYGRPLPQVGMEFLEGFQDAEAPAALNKCVRAHLKSHGPKHEHKMAGVGFLMANVFRVVECEEGVDAG